MLLLYGYLFYYVSALIGHSIGYHRYFSHRSFTTSKFAEVVMLFFGLICGGRSPLMWAAVHRMHHSKSDTDEDPHSPIFIGVWKVITSRFKVTYIPRKYLADLLKNPRVMFFHTYGKYIHITYAMIFLLIGWQYFIIFVMFPFLLAWFSFGLLNYFAHKNGQPENVVWLNFFAPGEAWHKTHHNSPRATSLHKFDIAGFIIERILSKSKSSS